MQRERYTDGKYLDFIVFRLKNTHQAKEKRHKEGTTD